MSERKGTVGTALDGWLEGLVPGAGSGASAPHEAPTLPASLRLTPVELLARGTCWVWRAHDPLLKRDVVVKVAPREGGEAVRRSLLREAHDTARIAHPAVVPVHAVTAADGLLCVIYALARGQTLAEHLIRWRSGTPWPMDVRLSLLADIAGALARAHGLSVVHGDLSPRNLVVDDDARPTVLDWAGLDIAPGTFSGTPEYAAPEQLAGGPPSPQADVFSLGAVAWEVLSLRPMRPALPSESVLAYLARHTPCVDPDPAPLQGLDPDLVSVLVAATATDPARRPASAQLSQIMSAVLTGRSERARRTADAAALLAIAQREMAEYRERERRVDEDKRVIAVQRAKVPPHAPASAKTALWKAEARHLAQVEAQAQTWASALEHAVRASALSPEAEDAHALIAELWLERLRMAEARGYYGEARLAEDRVRTHDRLGRHAAVLDAPAWLTVTGEGSMRLLAVVSDGPLLVERELGVWSLPVERLAVGARSLLLEVSAPGRQTVRIPVRPERLDHLTLAPRLPCSLPEGFVAVPAGPFRMGGDESARHALDPCCPELPELWVAATPVTSEAYLAFLQALPPEEARARAPSEQRVTGEMLPLWTEGLPAGWDPRFPVVGVSLDDALAYAAWFSQQTGLAARLPTEEEWEKAARGADGRPFPWGTRFDPALCHMVDSLPTAGLRPVGTFSADRSPYGVQDVAGLVHEWTSSLFEVGRSVIRGGSWRSEAPACRLAARSGMAPGERRVDLGFRLVIDPPLTDGEPPPSLRPW